MAFVDQQVALVERPGKAPPGFRQSPAVEVAAEFQHLEHPVELARDRAVAPSDLRAHLVQLAGDTIGLRGELQPLGQIGVVLDGVAEDVGGSSCSNRWRRVFAGPKAHSVESTDDVGLEDLPVRSERTGQVDLAEDLSVAHEVVCAHRQRCSAGGQ